MMQSLGWRSAQGSAVADGEAQQALAHYGGAIDRVLKGRLEATRSCRKAAVGNSQRRGYGQHTICNRTYTHPCTILTYGIEGEYSFEGQMREFTGCTVFGLDPTVNHRAEISPQFYFLKFAAPAPQTHLKCDSWAVGQTINKATGKIVDKLAYNCSHLVRDSHPDNDWVTVGPAKFASLVTPSPHKVSVLKMDCEGCEYALYDHAMEHDSLFFERVDQFVIEAHLSRKWAADWKSLMAGSRLV